MPSKIAAKTDRALTWVNYVNAIGEGAIVSRADMSAHFGVSVSTARYHLETAVERGFLNKQYGFISRQAGWLYALPETMPRLSGV